MKWFLFSLGQNRLGIVCGMKSERSAAPIERTKKKIIKNNRGSKSYTGPYLHSRKQIKSNHLRNIEIEFVIRINLT